MIHKLIILAILGIILIGTLQAEAREELYLLNNGLEVLMIENPALPMVGMNMIIKTGSAYETFASSGMSHMLEHLLFNGTTRRDQRVLYDDVDRIGGYNNAHTSTFYTNFMFVVPAEHALAGMDIQADMLFNSILPEEKFEKEKGIVLEEIAQSLSKASTQVEYDLQAQLYAGHALALPTLGTYNTIENMTRDDVYAYYRNHYRPNNMMLSIIGNFDSDTLLAHVKKIYGSAVPADVMPERSATMATGFQPSSGHALVPATLTRYYDGEDAVIHLIYKLPRLHMARKMELMSEILDEAQAEFSTGLETIFPDQFKDIRFDLRSTPIANHLVVVVTAKPGSDLDGIAELAASMVTGLRFKISETRIQALAAKRKTAYLQNLEKPHMFGIYYSDIFAEQGFDGGLRYLAEIDFSRDGKSLKKLRLKTRPMVLRHLPKPKDTESTGGKVKTQLLQAGPGQVLIARQNSANQLLAVHLLYKHKARWESEYGADAAQILHDCFGQRMKEPENLAASQQFGFSFTVNDNPYIPMDNIYLHPDFGYIRVEGLADDLHAALGFLFTQLNTFVPTQEEYDRAAAKFKSGMQGMGRDVVGDRFGALVDSVLYVAATTQTPETPVSYTGLLEFSRKYFAPANRVVSVVSPASPELVGQLIAPAAGPKQAPIEGWDKTLKAQPAEVNIEQDGGGERSYLFWGYVKDVTAEDKAALKALSLILSDRIVFDIREKQGMAYRMSAGISVYSEKALMYIRVGTRPQNVDVLVPQLSEFLSSRMVADLSAEELEKSVNMYLGRMMFRRLSSINQAYYLGTSQYFENDMLADEAAHKALGEVSLADVQRVAAKYLVPENTIQILLR